MRRTQIYLGEDQARRLDERATRKGVTRSTMIREAIERYLAGDEPDQVRWRESWRDAVARTSGIAPDLPPGEQVVEEMRHADAARLDRLDDR